MRYVIVITDLYHRYSVLGFEHGDTPLDALKTWTSAADNKRFNFLDFDCCADVHEAIELAEEEDDFVILVKEFPQVYTS